MARWASRDRGKAARRSTTLQLSEPVLELLFAIANRDRVSRSTIVERALRAYSSPEYEAFGVMDSSRGSPVTNGQANRGDRTGLTFAEQRTSPFNSYASLVITGRRHPSFFSPLGPKLKLGSHPLFLSIEGVEE